MRTAHPKTNKKLTPKKEVADLQNIAEEPGISYGASSYGINMFPPFQGHRQPSAMTPMEKWKLVRIGISKKDLEGLKEKTELDYDNLSAALSVTRATLINKKGNEKFSSSVSEAIVSLADIYAYGYEVFEDEKNFNNWMFRPNKALGGEMPYALLDNQFGREEVKNIIGRIDYGVHS